MFEKNIDEFDDKLDEHNFVRMKLLPFNTIYPAIRTLNNERFIYKVTREEAIFFGYDRVHVNTNAYPAAPVQIMNQSFNDESLPLYLENEWRNKDGFQVYLTDENGKFVRGQVIGPKLNLVTIPDDARQFIYGEVDPRIVPPEAVYKSSIDWFRSRFHIAGKEINPFIVRVNVKDVFDEKLKDFEPVAILTTPIKFGNEFIWSPIEDGYLTKTFENTTWKWDKAQKRLIHEVDAEFIDYKNGTINFSALGPGINYQIDEHKYLCGIKYRNTFSSSGRYAEIWSSKILLQNNIIASFNSNTTENLANKTNRDFGIADITEMGLFNSRGQLIAYCHHPKVQYRTDTQHLSYNLIIKEVV